MKQECVKKTTLHEARKRQEDIVTFWTRIRQDDLVTWNKNKQRRHRHETRIRQGTDLVTWNKTGRPHAWNEEYLKKTLVNETRISTEDLVS